MKFRPFRPDDAETCFRLRSSAFILKFYRELTKEDIAAAVNAYMPSDYVVMAERMPFFIVETGDETAGFFTLKRIDEHTAELPLIYVALENIGKGIGHACIDYMDEWLSANWPEIETLIVDTVIPEYNGGFYRKVGFVPAGDVFCEFQGHRVKALRLAKRIRNPGENA